MTPSELKYQYEKRYKTKHYFDRALMRGTGDTMRNYRVCSTENGKYWELWRRHAVQYGGVSSAFFRKSDFKLAEDPDLSYLP